MGRILSGRGPSRVASGVTVKGLPMTVIVFEAGLGVKLKKGALQVKRAPTLFDLSYLAVKYR